MRSWRRSTSKLASNVTGKIWKRSLAHRRARAENMQKMSHRNDKEEEKTKRKEPRMLKRERESSSFVVELMHNPLKEESKVSPSCRSHVV